MKLIAMADVFKDHLESSLRILTAKHKDRVDVPPDDVDAAKLYRAGCPVAVLRGKEILSLPIPLLRKSLFHHRFLLQTPSLRILISMISLVLVPFLRTRKRRAHLRRRRFPFL